MNLDTAHFEKALKKDGSEKERALINGIADSEKCSPKQRSIIRSFLLSSRQGAIIHDEPVQKKRNEAAGIIKGLGNDLEARPLWGKLTRYSQRSW
ncbi:hypothetical protein [Rhabdochlamydiaceae symbiont of Dictyostelium giganteum]|uniref:hypothetical protein n=1 Tax=Rhabdochlamydiaceae symbiont of Dictyostelium giganteum TaxID=3342349 RepID=UPI00384BEC2C